MIPIHLLLGAVSVALWIAKVLRPLYPLFHALQRLLQAAQSALHSTRRLGALPVDITISKRSLAVGRLREAIILRSKAIDQTTLDKETADKEVYNSCIGCYGCGVSRTEVQKIIKCIVSEFRVPVA